MMHWRVWITVYPGSYVDVEAGWSRDAIRVGAKKLRGSWGETVEINAREIDFEYGLPADGQRLKGPTFTRIVRIGAQGVIESW